MLQQYRPGKTLDHTFPKDLYCKESLDDLKRILSEFIENVEIRGA